jgi:hypothetical protein
MIKIILITIISLALLGGAVKFASTEEGWSLVVNKQTALNSVQNGALMAYEFGKDLVQTIQSKVK